METIKPTNNEQTENIEKTAISSETVSKVPQLLPYQWKKGQSGNPSGRPKETLKDYVKRRLASMSEEEKDNYLHGLSKLEIWKMAEGNPDSSPRDEEPPEGSALKLTGTAFLDENGELIVSKQTAERINGNSKITTEQIPQSS